MHYQFLICIFGTLFLIVSFFSSIVIISTCDTYSSFHKIAPVKVKVLRFNNNGFMTKSLRKAIMLRSRLKNNFNKGLNCKCNSKKMLHRDYKRFDQKKFETELKLKFTNKLKLLYFLSCVPRNFKQDCTS